MDILLVNPNHDTPNNIPWGVLSVGSYLKTFKGYDVELLDATILGETKTLEEIRRRLPETSLVGLACFSMDTPFVKAAADLIKAEKPECRVIVGGPHATLCPEQTAAYENIDFAAYNEGEETTAILIETLRSPNPDFSQVPGLIYKEQGDIKKTALPPRAPFYDADYTLLEKRVQASFNNYIQVLAGRGCSFKCTFCFNGMVGQKWLGYPMESVMEQIDVIVQEHDPKVIYFRDEDFFQDRERIHDFIRLYREKDFHFEWRANCRANWFNDRFVNEELWRDLISIGCTCLKFGFESGSPAMLKKLKKGNKIEQYRNVLAMFKKTPLINLNVSFLIGVPEETYEDMRLTLDLCGEIIRESPNVTINGPQYFRVYPGGELYNKIIDEYDFRVPDSLEGWAEQYDSGKNKEGYADEALDYPWVPREHRYLARNAKFLVVLARPFYPAFFSPFKRALLWPFSALARLRFRMGWYRGLIDVRIARLLYDINIVRWLLNSRRYARLKEMEWYTALCRTKLFGALRALLTSSAEVMQSNSTGLLVFARMDSSRLPGKALHDVAGRPLLGRVVDRARRVGQSYPVVIATTDRAMDDPIAAFAEAEGLPVFRGATEDVANRAVACAETHRFHSFVRISGDSPFIDPDLIREMIQIHREKDMDICTNIFPRTFPPGNSIEVIATQAMRQACESLTECDEREHVTPYFYRHPEKFTIHNVSIQDEFNTEVRLTVDQPKDMDKTVWIIQQLGDSPETAPFDQIVRLAGEWQVAQS